MATNYVNLPGVKINEVPLGPPPIVGVSTSIAAFVGKSPLNRFTNLPKRITSADEFRSLYVLRDPDPLNPIEPGNAQSTDPTGSTDLSRAIFGFFANSGQTCYVVNTNAVTATAINAGIDLLEPIDEINIIAAPGQTDTTVYAKLQDQANRTGDRFALLDPPPKVANDAVLLAPPPPATNIRPKAEAYSAFYYPRILVGFEVKGDSTTPVAVTPIGHIAGVFARVDTSRGVHKAPANERLLGALGVEDILTDARQDSLNAANVNVLRLFTEGVVIWGARTLAADATYRYVNVRRLVNYIEESLQEGLRWAVFEPNTDALRKQITRSVRGFLDGVWRDGGLFGATANDAYYVRFPDIYNSPTDRSLGKLTLEIGLRVAYPAEFIIIRIGVLTQD